MKKRVAEIEDVMKGAQCVHAPSLYISVATTLEVWAILDPSSATSQTIFYKAPKVQECNSIIGFSNPNHDAEEALMTMKVDPWMAHLVEKAGTIFDETKGCPPSVCEEW